MLKKLLFVLVLLPSIAFGQSNIPQGGTGLSTSTPGDLLVGTSSIRYSRLPIGSSGTVLQASSTSPFRMAWVTLSSIFDSLLSSNNTWTGTNNFTASTTLTKIIAGTSAGLQFFSNGLTQIADFGAGGGSNASFLGGVNVTGNLAVDTDTLYVDSTNNNVGIGTTSPQAPLHIYSSGGDRALILDGANNYEGIQFRQNNSDAGYISPQGNGSVADLFISAADTLNFRTGSGGSSAVGGTTRLVIDASGNVGIGTTSPTSLLHLASTGSSLYQTLQNNSSTFGDIGINSSAAFAFDSNGPWVWRSKTYANRGTNTATTEYMRLSATGNLGIGTTGPVTVLDIAGSGTGAVPATSGTAEGTGHRMRIGHTAGGATLDIGTAGATGMWLNVVQSTDLSTHYPLLLQPNGGNVGIGSLVGTPSAPLHIFTPVANSTTVTGQYIINAGSGSGAGAKILMGYSTSAAASGGIGSFYSTSHFNGTNGVKTALEAGGTTFLTGSVTGDVGIGTTTPSARLAIQGTSGSTTPLFSIASSSGSVVPIVQVIPTATFGGFVGINAPTPTYQLEISSDANSNGRGLLIGQHSNDVGAAVLTAQKSRGTRASPTTVVSGDYTFAFAGQSYDGSAYRNTANFGYRTSGTIASNSIPGQWFFAATSSNDTNPYTNGTVRMVIGSDGNVGIGTTTPNSVLTIASSTTSTSASILNIFNSLSTPIMRVLGSGAVLFGTITTANCGNAPCGLTVATTTQFTAGVVPRVVGYSSAASTTINLNTTDIATTTITRATTFVNPTGTAYDGQMFEIRARATTTQTVYWDTVFASSTDLTNVSSVASGTTRFLFEYRQDVGKWELVGKLGQYIN